VTKRCHPNWKTKSKGHVNPRDQPPPHPHRNPKVSPLDTETRHPRFPLLPPLGGKPRDRIGGTVVVLLHPLVGIDIVIVIISLIDPLGSGVGVSLVVVGEVVVAADSLPEIGVIGIIVVGIVIDPEEEAAEGEIGTWEMMIQDLIDVFPRMILGLMIFKRIFLRRKN